MDTNDFSRDLGKGQYKEAGDNSTITFFDVNNKLVLTRNDFSF